MSVFYPGQRVRVVRSDDAITDPFVGRETLLTRRSDTWGDYWLTTLPAPAGYSCVHVHGDYIEPILPEGLESKEEIDALYEPEIAMEIGLIGMRVENLP